MDVRLALVLVMDSHTLKHSSENNDPACRRQRRNTSDNRAS
jgi:hypothetical protein